MKRSALVLLLTLPASAALAADKWEFGFNVDDTSGGATALLHGVRQLHDLEGPAVNPDQDWFRLYPEPRHSYEVRIVNATVRFASVSYGTTTQNADLDRVSGATVLQSATGPTTEVYLRWTQPSGGIATIRVKGSSLSNYGPTEQYEIEMVDTTCFGSRFNNSGTQSTIVLVSNTTAVTLTGAIFFYSADGTLLFTEGVSIPANGVKVMNSSLVPELAGQSGSIAVAHDGPYGAVAGKAVALEPATGFTFDTPITPMPR